ncbi:hypothetical protein H8B02_18065 [Bradyrhizobium sp. Pear77]|nr:hypothetical protein [Bradyrhizobium altum]
MSQWLFANNKPGIAARLDNKSLDKDAEAFRKSGGERQVVTALAHLRASQSAGGVALSARHANLNPYPEDADLIEEYKAAESQPTARNYAPILTGFSDHLLKNNKQSIAARLSDPSLDEDIKRYQEEPGSNAKIRAALAHLRKSPAAAQAIEFRRHVPPVPDPEEAVLMEPGRVGDAAAQDSASEGAVSSPVVLPAVGYDQDLLWALADEADPSLPLEPTARHHWSPDPGESSHPLNWPHAHQQAPDELMGALPGEEVLINDEHYEPEARLAKRQRTLDNPQGAIERQLSEIERSGGRVLMQAPIQQLGASPSEAQPMIQARGDEYTRAPHPVTTDVGAVGSPVVLPAEGYNRDLLWAMVEDRPPWSGHASPEQAQEAEKVGRQEPAGSASTWSLQVPSNFDWSSSRPEEIRGLQDDQPAPSVFVQEHVAFDPEQMSPGKLRRVLDHLDDQSMASPASVDPEELLRLEQELRRGIQGGQNNQPAPSFSVGPDFDPEQFTFEPGALRRLLDDEPAPFEVDHVARHREDAVLIEPRRVDKAVAQDSAWQEAGSRPEEIRGLQDDQPAPSVFVQEHVAFGPEMSPGELRRVLDHLDDQAIPAPASVDPEGLLRLEQELRQGIQGGQNNQPAPSFSVGPDFDPEQLTFEPGELRRLLDDEPAQLGASSSGPADQ